MENDIERIAFVSFSDNDVVTDMCLGCELTYSFNGFVLDEANSSLNRLRFLGGTVNFFTDIPGDFLIGDQATAQNGTHWLSIEGHEFLDVLNTPPLTNVTLTANLTGGHLMFDTLSGPAAEFFDTNSIPDFLGGFADFEVNSSVVSYYSNGIAGDSTGNNDISSSAFAADVLLTAIGLGIDPNDIGVDVGAFFIDHMGLNNVASTGSLDMRGQSVPEPTVLYLMGLGLLGFGAVRNRKNA